MLEKIIERTENYLRHVPKKNRKNVGQFFTGLKTARFMANMLEIPNKENLVVLDPGAGSGILAIAFLERLEHLSWRGSQLQLICYETDETILPLLRENLDYVKKSVSFSLIVEIRNKNYITSQNIVTAFADVILCNPPYLKINRQAPEALAMPYVVHGAPNLYFLFAARSIENLCENGEMVYIMPRSWTSGAYFAAFRKFLFENAAILQLHLFISRDKIFSQVLQETMILRVKKTRKQPDKIKVTTSDTADFLKIKSFVVSSNRIVSKENNHYVFLVTNQNEENILEQMENFHYKLPSLDMKMKTGLTVDFREREYLTSKWGKDNIPLFYAQHIKKGKVIFPINGLEEWLKPSARSGLRQKNQNYLFFKRFTAKEENRRLQCGVYLANDFPKYREISTHNKLDFITGINKSLSLQEVYGLYVLFNSTLYDQYYRILNGSTQVNATEMNSMPIPELRNIIALGKNILNKNDFTTQSCDEILEEYYYE